MIEWYVIFTPLALLLLIPLLAFLGCSVNRGGLGDPPVATFSYPDHLNVESIIGPAVDYLQWEYLIQVYSGSTPPSAMIEGMETRSIADNPDGEAQVPGPAVRSTNTEAVDIKCQCTVTTTDGGMFIISSPADPDPMMHLNTDFPWHQAPVDANPNFSLVRVNEPPHLRVTAFKRIRADPIDPMPTTFSYPEGLLSGAAGPAVTHLQWEYQILWYHRYDAPPGTLGPHDWFPNNDDDVGKHLITIEGIERRGFEIRHPINPAGEQGSQSVKCPVPIGKADVVDIVCQCKIKTSDGNTHIFTSPPDVTPPWTEQLAPPWHKAANEDTVQFELVRIVDFPYFRLQPVT